MNALGNTDLDGPYSVEDVVKLKDIYKKKIRGPNEVSASPKFRRRCRACLIHLESNYYVKSKVHVQRLVTSIKMRIQYFVSYLNTKLEWDFFCSMMLI